MEKSQIFYRIEPDEVNKLREFILSKGFTFGGLAGIDIYDSGIKCGVLHICWGLQDHPGILVDPNSRLERELDLYITQQGLARDFHPSDSP